MKTDIKEQMAAEKPDDVLADIEAKHGLAAPTWYTSEEMLQYLRRRKYSAEIAAELSREYAFNLQKAFSKGWELGTRKATTELDAVKAALGDVLHDCHSKWMDTPAVKRAQDVYERISEK